MKVKEQMNKNVQGRKNWGEKYKTLSEKKNEEIVERNKKNITY